MCYLAMFKQAVIITTTLLLVSALFGVVNGDCASECGRMSYSTGAVIGTGPFCGGGCSDCGNTKCLDYWSEGAGCWTGHKVCCCYGQIATTTASGSIPSISVGTAINTCSRVLLFGRCLFNCNDCHNSGK